MSSEEFPTGEKLATDLDSLIAWLVREMGYSRDKTTGYEEKRTRLARDPGDDQSVFDFMSNYWHRFQQIDTGVAEKPEPLMVSKALQAYGKVVAGVCDKVALALWLQAQADQSDIEPEQLLESALAGVKEYVGEISGMYTDEALLAFINEPFEENPMGQSVLGLHESYGKDVNDYATLYRIALEGSAAGVLMWQAYARSLEEKDVSSVMPRPGLSSGELEAWE